MGKTPSYQNQFCDNIKKSLYVYQEVFCFIFGMAPA